MRSGPGPVDGPRGDDLDAALAALTPRLRALDDAPPPDPSFVTRLEEELMDHAAYARQGRRPGGANGRAASVIVAPPPAAEQARRRWPTTELMVAAVLLLTLAVGFAGRGSSRDAPGRDGSRLAAIGDGTPSAGAPECDVEPRSLSILGGEGTPAGLDGTPVATLLLEATPAVAGTTPWTAREDDLPSGSPASDAAVAGIRSTVLAQAFCLEWEGQEWRMALFSDDYFRRSAVVDRGEGAVLFPPLPDQTFRAEGVRIRDARLLPDGRVGAVVEGPELEPTFAPVFVVFVEGRGRWFIDEWGWLGPTAETIPGGGLAVPPVGATPPTFVPTLQVVGTPSINVRAGPSHADNVIFGLLAWTRLEDLGERRPTRYPDDGANWLKVRTEDGREGWVREIDVGPVPAG